MQCQSVIVAVPTLPSLTRGRGTQTLLPVEVCGGFFYPSVYCAKHVIQTIQNLSRNGSDHNTYPYSFFQNPTTTSPLTRGTKKKQNAIEQPVKTQNRLGAVQLQRWHVIHYAMPTCRLRGHLNPEREEEQNRKGLTHRIRGFRRNAERERRSEQLDSGSGIYGLTTVAELVYSAKSHYFP